MKGRGTLAAAVLLCAAWASGAQPPAPEQPLTFRTEVELVTVDVTVVDRQGQPVRGLGAKDFSVSVSGQPRRVVSAEFVDRTAALQAPVDPDGSFVSTNEGARGGRVFVFIVDQNTLEPGAARRVAAASSHLLARLTPADRSALMVMPLGPNVDLTWAHHQVREALDRIGGLASPESGWEYGSLAEARDIASHNMSALRLVAERECGASGRPFGPIGPGGTVASSGPPPGGSSGGGAGDSEGDGGSAPAPAGGGGGGQSMASPGFGDSRGSQCVRALQVQAETTWRAAETTSLSSVTSLRQVLAALARVGGDKTIVLISGGWPLQDRDQMSLLGMVAMEAAAARATVFPFFVPVSTVSASRRFMTSSPVGDEQVHVWALETLAGMTGGAPFRVEVGAEAAFDRLAQEMSGHYRIGVERSPADLDGKPRQLKVQVARGGTTVRAREIFDVPTYEDRNWSARLNAALVAPAPATGVGLRVTSYIGANRDDSSRLRLLLAGEATRLHPGDATFQFVLRDQSGKQLVSEEQLLGTATEDHLPFSVDIPLAPGTYTVRLAVMDSSGSVGSVDHRVDARHVSLGPLSGFGPLLVRVPREEGAKPTVALEGVRHGERLALQVDLAASSPPFGGAEVMFEIAETADGPPLVQLPASLSPDTSRRAALAEAIADVRLLPPGRYVARARVWANGEEVGDLRRPFEIVEGLRAAAVGTGGAVAGGLVSERLATRVAGAVPRFGVEEVLAPRVLAPFLDEVAARPDASLPAVQQLLDQARSSGGANLVVPDALRAEAPAAAFFLSGLSLLAEGKLDPAANAFRDALRASPDFYPAMVYLGACYAAGGKDGDAAGAWRTALIKEGDAVALHALLAEALLRQGKGDMAFQVLGAARDRWPDDSRIGRQFAMAAIASGRYVDGLEALEDLIEGGGDDPRVIELALLVLYEAFTNGEPVVSAEHDFARMTRLADVYRDRGGPSIALVERWMATIEHK